MNNDACIKMARTHITLLLVLQHIIDQIAGRSALLSSQYTHKRKYLDFENGYTR